MLYYYLLSIFLIICLVLLYAYIKEIKYRHQPYYQFPEKAGLASLASLPVPSYSVALLGDIGYITDTEKDGVFLLLQQWMETIGENGTIILLGDNIYPKGLPPEDSRHRTLSEKRLLAQLHVLQHFPGQVIYLSGNHDWNKGRKDGLSYVLRQQEFVLRHLKPGSYLPLNGCPGPVTIPLAKGLCLIIINTQWWVQRGIRPIGKTYDCDIESEDDFFEKLKNILDSHRHEQIIIAAHHPLYSNAQHGGNFTLKQHVFPLTAAHDKIYVPLPVAGSLYPAYRKLFGAYEDMSHPRYRRMRKKLLKLFNYYKNIVYVAGHDHNLQYFPVKGNHYVVSGSGSKTAYVKKGGRAAFTHEHKGFFLLDYYEAQNSAWLRALEPVVHPEKQSEVVFQQKII